MPRTTAGPMAAMQAQPMPWAKRATIRMGSVGESAQASEDRVKMIKPVA